MNDDFTALRTRTASFIVMLERLTEYGTRRVGGAWVTVVKHVIPKDAKYAANDEVVSHGILTVPSAILAAGDGE